METPEFGELDKVLANLTVYSEPDLFVPEHTAKFKKGKQFQIKKIKRYNELLLSISWFVKKVARYEIYFEKFYTTDPAIPQFEAVEHHIHSCLEDVATVKNKIEEYLNALKNDLNQIAINKKEVKAALTWLNGQVYKAFEKMLDLRNPHRHKGYKFVDGNITDAEMAYRMLAESSPLRSRLSEHGIHAFEQKLKEAPEKAKKQWVENARKNRIQVEGIANEVIEKTQDFLYQYLDIQPEYEIKTPTSKFS